MNEKELANEVKNQLVEAQEELSQKVKNYINCQCSREFQDNINFEKLKSECSKLGIHVDLASNIEYYKKQIVKKKFKDCYIFTIGTL